MKTAHLVWTAVGFGAMVVLDQACAAGAPPNFFYGDAGFTQSSTLSNGDDASDSGGGDDSSDTGSASGSSSGSSAGSNSGSGGGSSTGSTPAMCDAMSCPTGCCDMNGMCQTNNDSACGSGGGTCQNCTMVGGTCQTGACSTGSSGAMSGSTSGSSSGSGGGCNAKTCKPPGLCLGPPCCTSAGACGCMQLFIGMCM
ncbi:MAG TPA: hypothetical protein VKU41_12145 [Polyangiaceae bacterium]|nr:hypothetical protein [Polyangiaceae bacterium]